MPTDTIYGLVGSALKKKVVERIYKVKRRNPKKPIIILIGTLVDLEQFGIRPDVETNKILQKLWLCPPKLYAKVGPVSVILQCRGKKFGYLHRNTKTLAFRVPNKKPLRALLQKTGPLVAPSANWQGYPPAKTIKEAKKYFGENVYPEPSRRIDFYIDGGKLYGKPSTLIAIHRGKVVVLRQGSGIIKE